MAALPYFVYILANDAHTRLHVGYAEDLLRSVTAHRIGQASEITRRYNVDILVYVEEVSSSEEAIQRVKELNASSSRDKLRLIEEVNPDWQDVLSRWGRR